MKLSLCILGSLLLSLSAPAQTLRYVRPGAAGNGSGTDWVNAYPSVPGSLSRGTTYFIADGSYGYHTFSDGGSGTITLKKATVANHGTATGWSDSYGAGTAFFSGFAFTTPNYVIDGSTRNSDWRSGYGFKVTNGGGQKAIDLGTGPGAASWQGNNSTAGNITFKNLEVQAQGMDKHVADTCVAGLWGINNVTISACYFHDSSQGFIMTDHNSNWVLEYSIIARGSTDSTYHGYGWAAQGDNNITIRYNIWEDINGTSYIDVLNRDSNPYVNSNWDIYGNVFAYTWTVTSHDAYNRGGVGDGVIAVINNESAVNWNIFNNSFIGIAGGLSSRVEIGANGAAGNKNVFIRNNLWWNCVAADHTLANCTGCESSFNRYDATASPAEANKETHAVADKLLFVDFSARDFRLASATLPGQATVFNTDPNGMARGADGNWDRGAYELGTNTAIPVITNQPPPIITNLPAGTLNVFAATDYDSNGVATVTFQFGKTPVGVTNFNLLMGGGNGVYTNLFSTPNPAYAVTVFSGSNYVFAFNYEAMGMVGATSAPIKWPFPATNIVHTSSQRQFCDALGVWKNIGVPSEENFTNPPGIRFYRTLMTITCSNATAFPITNGVLAVTNNPNL